MTIELVYFEDCPHWKLARQRLDEAIAAIGSDRMAVRLHPVTTPEEGEAAGLRGSPTMLINGQDPFQDAPSAAWSCRLYRNQNGIEGAPSVQELTAALQKALKRE